MSHLWVFDLASSEGAAADERRVHRRVSSAGRRTARRSRSITASTPTNTSGGTADISVVAVADGKVRALVTQPGADAGPIWSPDGSKIAFDVGDDEGVLLPQRRDRRRPRRGRIDRLHLTTAFDEDPSDRPVDARRHLLQRARSGPRRSSSASTRPRAPSRSTRPPISGSDPASASRPTASGPRSRASDASTLARSTSRPSPRALKPRKLTDMTAQIDGWAKSALDVISWKSQDGATIEGVLHKPIGFQAGTQVSAARRDPRRPHRHLAAVGVFEHQHLSDRHLDRAAARSSSSRTTAAAPATARRSARSTCATSASATRGTCSRGSIS